jgi:hypothetical protein
MSRKASSILWLSTENEVVKQKRHVEKKFQESCGSLLTVTQANEERLMKSFGDVPASYYFKEMTN